MTDIIAKAKNLINQIDMSDYTNEDGMKLKMNLCLKELRESIDKYESERIDRKYEINLRRL
jgi:hypothetical protein